MLMANEHFMAGGDDIKSIVVGCLQNKLDCYVGTTRRCRGHLPGLGMRSCRF